MKGKIIAVLLLAVIAGTGAWYYATQVSSTPIGNILANPRDYMGRETAISGTVTERFSLFIVSYFMVRDPTGEIPVVTGQTMPAVGAQVRVEGQVQEGFSLGDRQMIVFVKKQKTTQPKKK